MAPNIERSNWCVTGAEDEDEDDDEEDEEEAELPAKVRLTALITCFIGNNKLRRHGEQGSGNLLKLPGLLVCRRASGRHLHPRRRSQ